MKKELKFTTQAIIGIGTMVLGYILWVLNIPSPIPSIVSIIGGFIGGLSTYWSGQE